MFDMIDISDIDWFIQLIIDIAQGPNSNSSGPGAENKPGICQVNHKITRHRVGFDLWHPKYSEMPWE